MGDDWSKITCINGVSGDGAVANQDLARAWSWDWPGDDLELGFGRGDDGCVVGHFGFCFNEIYQYGMLYLQRN